MKRAFLLLFLLPTIAFSQVFKSNDSKKSSSFTKLLSEFDEYKHSHDLSKTRGWKWYKRWESHYEQRTPLSGKLADPNIFFTEAKKIQAQKNFASKNSNANWMPYGPSELPPSVDQITSHGMGRINCIAFHPTDSATIFVGVAQGGVWKSTNSGASWTPLTDQLPIIRISDIAIDPTNPNTMYISVGDYGYLGISLQSDGRKRHTHYGIGVYKTIDGGNTWTETGLSLSLNTLDESLIRRVMVNPANPQELVAVGISGIYKSYNAGTTWTKKNSSIIWDFEANPKNANTLYASTGYIASLNEGSAGILKSTNFGETWTALTTNIPAQQAQRVEMAISATDTNYIYAITCGLDRGFEGFYRSTNAGTTWTKRYSNTSGVNLLGWDNSSGGGGQGTYDLAIVVDGNNKNKVYVGGINMWGTTDGGATWDGMSYWLPYYGQYLHADQHQFKYNPLNNAYYVSNDGGLYRTDSAIIGSWTSANNDPNYSWPTRWKFIGSGMQISSFYRLSIRKRFGDIIAGAQDNSTFYKNSGKWVNMIGGDGMDCALHPTDTDILYGSSQYGNIVQSLDGGFSFNYLNIANGEDGEWTTPIKLDPDAPEVIYAGYENMHVSMDQGMTFDPISAFPTMSTGAGAVISAFDFSVGHTDFIYVAKRIVHQQNEPMKFYVTTNGGASWSNRTAGLPDSLYCTAITVDNVNPQTAWACFSGFAYGVKVFKTTDAGATWTNVSMNLPNIPVNAIIHQHGSTANVVYIGTDAGVYYTYDGLNKWELYSNLLPNVIVSDLEIHADSNKLFAATFGRGIWATDLVDVNVGISQNPIQHIDLNLFPNKNKGEFTVSGTSIEVSSVNISIINILGKEIYKEHLNIEQGKLYKNYQLQLLPGEYFYRIQSGKYSVVKKFIVE